jgi:hypothetical protein
MEAEDRDAPAAALQDAIQEDGPLRLLGFAVEHARATF